MIATAGVLGVIVCAVAQAAPVRPATRPTLTPEEYEGQATLLRVTYSGPSSRWPAPLIDEGVEHREIGLLPNPQFPTDNPYSKAKEELGKQLFFDPRLSGSGQIACASCHDPDFAWADGRTVSFGHDRAALKRNSPSIQYVAYLQPLFWDGRAATLEEQFNAPVTPTSTRTPAAASPSSRPMCW